MTTLKPEAQLFTGNHRLQTPYELDESVEYSTSGQSLVWLRQLEKRFTEVNEMQPLNPTDLSYDCRFFADDDDGKIGFLPHRSLFVRESG
jgi:hypothetical protein